MKEMGDAVRGPREKSAVRPATVYETLPDHDKHSQGTPEMPDDD